MPQDSIKIVGKIALPPKKKVNFYFDGFNFYRGIKEAGWKEYYWLDIFAFSKALIGKYKDWEVQNVNYYTAKPWGKEKKRKQNILLDANVKFNGGAFRVHYGSYTSKTIDCLATCKQRFKWPEEKGADVGVAVNIIGDALLKNCDVSVLVSGDNDQLPTLKFIKEKLPHHKVLVFFPPHREKNELGKHCYHSSHLLTSRHMFEKCVWPETVTFADATTAQRPSDWPGIAKPGIAKPASI